MAFTYILPGDKLGDPLRETEQNSIIIIGANGSGKSRLGAWVEQTNLADHHRISGQRILNFSANIPLEAEVIAANKLWYGHEVPRHKEGYRWNNKFTTTVLDDSNAAFSLVFAKKASQDREYVSLCKQAEKEGHEKPATQEDIIEKLVRVWNSVFPHRQLMLEDNQIKVIMPDGTANYSGTEMSDGEKACLYLIAQCLAVPDNKKIIIDEPELHLHRSIMNKLWDELEKARPNCLFIYITHDTNFAANHRSSQKIWVKNYDGQNWIFEYIEDSELPQQLLLDILGNRKKVLFVEGDTNSPDIELCSQFYQGYYIIPCGSCATVIENVRAMRKERQLNHIECFGIIDRDFRTEQEIEALAKNHIFALKVAEVENLFCTEGILHIINQQLGKPNEDAIIRARTYLYDQFTSAKTEQVANSVLTELKHQIKMSRTKERIAEVVASYDEIKERVTEKFDATNDHDAILKVFNRKGVVSSIGVNFGLQAGPEYKRIVSNLFRGSRHNDIMEALKPYMPSPDDIPYKA